MNGVIEQIRQKRAASNAVNVEKIKAAIATVWHAVRTTRALTSDQLAELERAMELTGIKPGHLLLLGEVDKAVKECEAVVNAATRAELDDAFNAATEALKATKQRHAKELEAAAQARNKASSAVHEHTAKTEALERLKASFPAWIAGDVHARASGILAHDLQVIAREHGIERHNGTAFPLPLPADGAPAAEPAEPQPVEVIASDETDASEKPKLKRRATA